MNEIILFDQKQVRRVRLYDEWWFVISDVVAVLTDSVNPSDYLKKLRKRDQSLSDAFKGRGQIVSPLGFEFDTEGEPQKMRKRDAELGTYIGTNCPHVEMLTHTNKKTETVKLGIKQKYELVMKKKLNCRHFVYS